ncbi:MAG: hypothetical protein KF884_08245 [Fimbriimonadaceae bacterium]|nr:hypothetical protein [Fimbriimonadaceae bacterium]QYK57540.1 MAG: hypothetical protein KF884_08245 [Fimbriimonadaceae bacterium]
MRRDQAVLLLLFGGFVLLGLDVRYEHRHVVGEYWQGWLPIGACGLCAVSCLIGMGASRLGRLLCGAVFGLSILIGAYGAFLHTEGEAGEFTKYLTARETVVLANGNEQGERKVNEAPSLAPLGLTGLAAIGLVVSQRWFKGGK